MHKLFYRIKQYLLNNEADGGYQLNVHWLLEAARISGSLVLMSFIVIAVLYWYAHRQLESFHKRKEEPKENPFWMEYIHGRARFKVYVFLSFTLSLGAVAADHFVPILVVGPTPWWWTIRSMPASYNVFSLFLLFFALMMGFLVPCKLYHFFKGNVLQDMVEKAEKTPHPEKTKRTLKMFTLVAGGSSLYQGVCVLFTVVFFIVTHLCFVIPQWQEVAGFAKGLDVRPFLGSWSALLIYALIGGVVGPMATTFSAFTIFCSSFKGRGFFDPLAEDRRGGFGSLGTLGMWSSFMAAVTPGVAIPLLFIDLKTTSEIAISVGLLFFLIICIILFFFVPVYHVHRAMKTSRNLFIQEFEGNYRARFNEFLKEVEDGKVTELTETLSMLALKEIYDDTIVISDWPVDYFGGLKVIASTILPVLSFIVKFLSLG